MQCALHGMTEWSIRWPLGQRRWYFKKFLSHPLLLTAYFPEELMKHRVARLTFSSWNEYMISKAMRRTKNTPTARNPRGLWQVHGTLGRLLASDRTQLISWKINTHFSDGNRLGHPLHDAFSWSPIVVSQSYPMALFCGLAHRYGLYLASRVTRWAWLPISVRVI